MQTKQILALLVLLCVVVMPAFATPTISGGLPINSTPINMSAYVSLINESYATIIFVDATNAISGSWNGSYYLRDTSRTLTGNSIRRDVNNDYLAIIGGTGGLPVGSMLALYAGANPAQAGGAIFSVGDAAGTGSSVVWSILGTTDDPELSMNNNKIVDLLNPTDLQDAATKHYVDDAVVAGSTASLNDYFRNDTTKLLFGTDLRRNVDNSYLAMYGGNAIAGGTGIISAWGKTSGNENAAQITVGDAAGTGNIELTGWIGGDAPRMDMNGYNITGIKIITNSTDAVNKSWTENTVWNNATLSSVINESYAYLPGRAGGQILNGGTGNNQNLTLNATTNGVGNVLINPNGGYVGIGTPSPQTSLHIQNTSPGTTGVLRIESITDQVGARVDLMAIGTIDGILGQILFFNGGDTIVDINAYRDNANDAAALRFRTQQTGTNTLTERMRITSTGNVGINTSSPTARLHILQQNLYTDAFRVDDVLGDTTPFVINETGNVGIGTTTPIHSLSVVSSGGGLQKLQRTDGGNWNFEITSGYGLSAGSLNLISTEPNRDLGFRAKSTGGNTLVIKSAGNVSIGSASPTARFETIGTVRFSEYGAGTATFDSGGNITSVSDPKFKDNMKSFTDGLSKILATNPISFNWNALSGLATKDNNVGFDAAQLRTAIPEAVYEKPDITYEQILTKPEVKDEKSGEVTQEAEYTQVEKPVLDKDGKQTTTLSISDRAIIATLVNAVKEQQVEIEAQNQTISKQELRIAALEKKVGMR